MFEFFITRPLGWIIAQIYYLVQNYGLAIILFTIVVKLLMLPLQIKSQKGMRKQQKIQPLVAELQKKYANDKEKLQTEMMKLYKENDVSMTGGCLPLLIQFPILIGLYQVIQKPMKYLLSIDFSAEDVITKIGSVVTKMSEAFPDNQGFIDYLKMKPEDLANTIQKTSQIDFLTWTRYLQDKFGEFSEWAFNFNFLGLDISSKPTAAFGHFSELFSGNFENISVILLLLVPIVAVLATWFSNKQMQKMSGTKPSSDDQTGAAGMSKTMNLLMPVMTGYFTLIMPSALGLYWIASSIMQIVTQYLINIYFDKKGDDFVVKIPEKNRKNSKKRR